MTSGHRKSLNTKIKIFTDKRLPSVVEVNDADIVFVFQKSGLLNAWSATSSDKTGAGGAGAGGNDWTHWYHTLHASAASMYAAGIHNDLYGVMDVSNTS